MLETSAHVRALTFEDEKKKKKKTYFASTNTTLYILPTYFTTYHTF